MATVALTGCGQDEPSDDGPLSAGVGSGGFAVRQPERPVASLRATFGAFVLCSERAGAAPVLRGVRLPKGAPAGVETWLRTVSGSDSDPPGSRVPVGIVLGAPPSFDQPYADRTEMGGEIRRGVDGVTVIGTCDQRGTVPFQELMVSVPSGPDGVVVDGFAIDYSVGDTAYTLRVDWEMTVCDRRGVRCDG